MNTPPNDSNWKEVSDKQAERLRECYAKIQPDAVPRIVHQSELPPDLHPVDAEFTIFMDGGPAQKFFNRPFDDWPNYAKTDAHRISLLRAETSRVTLNKVQEFIDEDNKSRGFLAWFSHLFGH